MEIRVKDLNFVPRKGIKKWVKIMPHRVSEVPKAGLSSWSTISLDIHSDPIEDK